MQLKIDWGDYMFSKIKKFIVITIILVLSITIAFILCKSEIQKLYYLHTDDLKECYSDDTEYFNTVAYELSKKVENINENYYGRLEKISYEKFKKKKEENYIYISNNMIIYPNPNTQSDYKELEYFNMYFSLYEVNKLISNAGLEHVDVFKDYILFVRKDCKDFKAYLLYSKNGIPPELNLYKYEKINNGWYYCVSE